VASVWIKTRMTKEGGRRYRVEYRLGGRESKPLYGGSFKTRREANQRRDWLRGELIALRAPDLRQLEQVQVQQPFLSDAAEAWRTSRVDVVEQTGNMHRSSFVRIFKVAPELRRRRVDELGPADVAQLVTKLVSAGYKRETIRKTRTALAQCLDFYEIEPNPARDQRVKLPKERRPHVPPPLAEHVERVVDTVAPEYVLPLLIIDECGPRVSELETTQIGDVDEHRRAIRIRWTFEKNERYRHLELPDDLFAALLETLPPREDRDLEAPLFPDLTDARLRMAITRACRATGTPHFSPHGLRRRRGSLHYKRTGSLAEVAELLGDSKRVAADHYVYALTDYREVDRSIALARMVAQNVRRVLRRCGPRCGPRPAEAAGFQGCSLPARPIDKSSA
jgi:integrase